MVHGWMDVGASFQFVVDALAEDRCIVAPDFHHDQPEALARHLEAFLAG